MPGVNGRREELAALTAEDEELARRIDDLVAEWERLEAAIDEASLRDET